MRVAKLLKTHLHMYSKVTIFAYLNNFFFFLNSLFNTSTIKISIRINVLFLLLLPAMIVICFFFGSNAMIVICYYAENW